MYFSVEIKEIVKVPYVEGPLPVEYREIYKVPYIEGLFYVELRKP